jgi:hypothetical protein
VDENFEEWHFEEDIPKYNKTVSVKINTKCIQGCRKKEIRKLVYKYNTLQTSTYSVFCTIASNRTPNILCPYRDS